MTCCGLSRLFYLGGEPTPEGVKVHQRPPVTIPNLRKAQPAHVPPKPMDERLGTPLPRLVFSPIGRQLPA